VSTILVIGASRGIGLETIRAALAAGHDVRALARNAGRISNVHPNLVKIDGDATDATLIGQAVAGTQAVIQTLGFHNYVAREPVTLFSRSTRALIPAMQEAGCRRLIAVTGLGAGDSRGIGNPIYTMLLFPLLLSRIYEDKDVQETMIRTSGLDWTIVRPGVLTNGAATGKYRVLTEKSQWGVGSISRADVARFLVSQITDQSLIGKTPLIIR
jgi:putative NADH-flavin reductase